MSGSRVQRLLQLINLMRSGQTLTVEDLADKMRVSRRTIFRDLDLLERSGVPCRHDHERRGYCIDEWYFLPPTSLTLHEAVGLATAATRIANAQNCPLHAESMRAVSKILQALPAGLRDVCERMVQVVEARWPPMADVTAIRTMFLKLQEAAVNARKVRLAYDSYYERREIVTVVHPYLLGLLNRAWYVVGLSELHQEVRTFNLDRVVRADLLADTFAPPSGFTLDKHLGNAWAMMREPRSYRVRMRFLPKVAGNIEEILWHPRQRTQQLPDGSLLFEVEVDGLTEISWWIMGYGDQVIVERPAELCSRLCQMARGILAHYAS